MKMVLAVFKPFKIPDVRDALEEVGVESFTFREVNGFGKGKGDKDVYRGVEFRPSYVSMMEITLVVEDDQADRVVTAIAGAAKTGETGDGKIFVTDVVKAHSISRGTAGSDAV